MYKTALLACQSYGIIPTVKQLHRLPVSESIIYKVLLFTYKALNPLALMTVDLVVCSAASQQIFVAKTELSVTSAVLSSWRSRTHSSL